MKKVRNFISGLWMSYCRNMYNIYKPCIEAGINPFI